MVLVFIRLIPTPVAAIVVLALLASGCGGPSRGPAVPHTLKERVQVPGMSDVRTWGDKLEDSYVQSLLDSLHQEVAYYQAHPELAIPKTVDILVISGGGEDGAFGAGLLCGWTAAGDRPDFKLVTGVSTGALIAPAAFLGSKYDAILRDNYTKVSQKDIFKKRGMLAIFTDDAVLDSSPLRRMVERIIDEQVLTAVAEEHRKGRRLLIGTTDLDAQRPVIWNMGAIAASGDPGALALFRDVMIASASIPGAFPPVYVKVEADGKTYHEMHVDGGTCAQLFLWGGSGFSRAVAKGRLGDEYLDRSGRLYIIRNSHVNPQWSHVTNRVLPIGMRAVATLIKTNGLNDVYRTYQLAQQNRMDYNLANIPEDFYDGPAVPFENRYMCKLFDLAYERAKSGYPWSKQPPVGITKPDAALTSVPVPSSDAHE